MSVAVKTVFVKYVTQQLSDKRCRNLAGEEGFEPSHVGIKIRCLNQLGDSPALDDFCKSPENLNDSLPFNMHFASL
jgi:hypothetical protein